MQSHQIIWNYYIISIIFYHEFLTNYEGQPAEHHLTKEKNWLWKKLKHASSFANYELIKNYDDLETFLPNWPTFMKLW